MRLLPPIRNRLIGLEHHVVFLALCLVKRRFRLLHNLALIKVHQLQYLLTEWYKPEEGIVAKNCAEILAEAAVVGLTSVECIVIFRALLAEFDGSVLIADQVKMEGEEGGDYEC